MKNFLTEYNLELLSALMFAFAAVASAMNPNPSVFQRALMLYAFLFTLHEWEEIRYPGGFAELMEGMIGKKFDETAKKFSHIPVVVLLLFIHIVPYILDSLMFLSLIPVFLGIFEGIIHTVGVKLSKAAKFYTPGMVTAYMLLLTSVILLSLYSANNMLEVKDCALGLLCLIACFALMQNRVLAINGIKYREMFNIIKNKL